MYLTIENDEDRIKIEQIYSKYKDCLYWVAYNILHDRMLSEDAVHETIIRAMGHIHNIDDINSYKTVIFLVIICRNVSIDIYRKNKKIWENECTMEDIEMFESGNENDPLEIYITNESVKGLIDTIKQLNGKYGDVLLLKYVSECSNKEIMSLLNISYDAVIKRVERGRVMLAKAMEKEEQYEN